MKKSAGLIMYRSYNNQIEILLVHPGGPYWKRKDEGAWSIPKGEYRDGENPLNAAKREFLEETGFIAKGEFIELEEIRQKGGKYVKAWIFEGNCDSSKINSNTFEMEWPPKSGTKQTFPEVDRAAWFPLELAREKILKSQRTFLDQLKQKIGA